MIHLQNPAHKAKPFRLCQTATWEDPSPEMQRGKAQYCWDLESLVSTEESSTEIMYNSKHWRLLAKKACHKTIYPIKQCNIYSRNVCTRSLMVETPFSHSIHQRRQKSVRGWPELDLSSLEGATTRAREQMRLCKWKGVSKRGDTSVIYVTLTECALQAISSTLANIVCAP